MNKIIPILFISFLLFGVSCSGKQKKLVLSVRNHQTTQYRMPYVIDDPSKTLHIKKNKSLMIVDGNGFTIPYQKIDSSKLIFMLNIKQASALKFTLKSTELEMNFDTLVRCFENNGDVFWENERSIYRMHSSKVMGKGYGIDCLHKNTSGFVNKDSVNYYDHYKEGTTLGCGGIAPYFNNHLVRYGNFTKMELLDSGPIFLRMRFIFPEFDLRGNKVHEERTVSMVRGLCYSKIESRFYGVDSLTIAVGFPLKDEKGAFVDTLSSNSRLLPEVELGKGYMCYAENFNDGNIGIVFSAVVMQERMIYGEANSDGHILALAKINDTSKPFVYYQGSMSSLDGINYDMWKNMALNFSNHVKSSLTSTMYEVE